MRDYKIVLTWEAIYDITDIAEYIESDFGIERADRFVREVQRELEKLGYMGASLPKTQFLYRGYSIHKKPYPPSIIFYVLLEDLEEVHVLRVLREEQDQTQVFGADLEYKY